MSAHKSVIPMPLGGNIEDAAFAMIVVGNTGEGKSQLCSHLVKDHGLIPADAPIFRADDTIGSVTDKPSAAVTTVTTASGSYQALVVDTGGQHDTEGRDQKHLDMLHDVLSAVTMPYVLVLVTRYSQSHLDVHMQRRCRICKTAHPPAGAPFGGQAQPVGYSLVGAGTLIPI